MIDFLRGKLCHCETDYVVLDVHDVGYRVFCANPLEFAGKLEQEVTLYTHHHVREDAILLFGFLTREEQSLFRKLLDVSGIGPRVAMGVLSAGRPDAIIMSIQQENITYLTKLPGIGKKTAQRMILDLKDKLGGIELQGNLTAAYTKDDALNGAGSPGLPFAWAEAKEGLQALGYSEAEIERAWRNIKDKISERETADVLLKQALQVLFKG